MPRYTYCLVEGTYVVRQGGGKTEWLTPDGQWIDYNDLWDVATNGRPLPDEERAMQVAKARFEENQEWWDEHFPQYTKRDGEP
jgi:hypothetical protein